DEGDRIGRAGPSYRARGTLIAQGAGNLAVASCFAERNLPQLLPDPALEGRGTDIQRQVGMGFFSCQQVQKLAQGLAELLVIAPDAVRRPEVLAQLALKLCLAVAQPDEADAPGGSRGQQAAQRRGGRAIGDIGPLATLGICRRGHADEIVGPFIDPAGRTVAGAICRGRHALALLQFVAEAPQPALIAIGPGAYPHDLAELSLQMPGAHAAMGAQLGQGELLAL